MKQLVFLMSGPAGSGKSTWIKKTKSTFKNPIRISRDEIRNKFVPEEAEDMFEREDEVLTEFYKEINDAIESGEHGAIFIDATHISERTRHQTISQLKHRENINLICVQMRVNLDLNLSRNEERSGRAKVPRGIVRRMFFSMTNPLEDTSHHFNDVWFIDSLGNRMATFSGKDLI